MEKNEMLSKEKLEQALQAALTQYLQTFYQNNFQNKLSEELVTGMGIKMIPSLITALEPWIPKEEKKEEVK